MTDEHKEEMISLYVFDLLEGGEKAAFEAELARDPALRKLVDELRAASNGLGLLPAQTAPSPALRQRVLASAKPHATGAEMTQAPARMPTQGRMPARIVRFPFAVVAGWAAAACFAIVAGVLALKVAHLSDDLSTSRQASEQAQFRLRHEADIAALKVSSMASLLADAPKAKATVVWNPLTQQGVLTVADLPGLEPDKDYQLWVVDPQYANPVNGGTFRVDPATGQARFTFKPNLVVNEVSKFAVSLERRGGVPKAQGPMVLISL